MNKTINKTTQMLLPQKDALLLLLQKRFEEHGYRHTGLVWSVVVTRLKNAPPKILWSIQRMEETGGEPDVIGQDKKTGAIIFGDCVAESPAERRSLCYDEEALNARKEHKPKGSAQQMAADMGVELMPEEVYMHLQMIQPCDLKTSSWISTPPSVRTLGGALYGDRRYDRVFVYHNGAESYYAARGWRGVVRV